MPIWSAPWLSPRTAAASPSPADRPAVSAKIKIWDVQAAAPKLVSTIQGHTDTILAVAFSPDGATIASAGYDKLLKIWEVATGKLIDDAEGALGRGVCGGLHARRPAARVRRGRPDAESLGCLDGEARSTR